MSEQPESQQQPIGSSSIREFCARHKIALSTFYELEKIGQGPRTYRVGRKIRRISFAAERDWLADREREALAEAMSATRQQFPHKRGSAPHKAL